MLRLRFHQFAWGLLAYNVAVILGGAFVRASVSGDGCGTHWPTCQGELIPHGGRLATFIEYGHRLSTGILLPLVFVLLAWAFRTHPKRHPVRTAAALVVVLTLVEGLIGAGLVLFRLVAQDASVGRALAMPAHLVTTFFLLMALTLTAWWGDGGSESRLPRLRNQGMMGWLLGMALLATLILGATGALVALGDTLFPAASLQEGLAQDVSPSRHFLISLRIFHPIAAILTGAYVLLIVALSMQQRNSPDVQRFGHAVGLLFAVQLCAGIMNFALLAPIWMQLVHLLLADLFWIALVLLTNSVLAQEAVATEPVAAQAWTEPLVAEPALAAPVHASRPSSIFGQYVALTKPRVISLLLLTAIAAMFIAAGVEGRPGPVFWLCMAVGLGFYMAAGAANAINMVLERDLDLRMGRTAKRPTVTERIPVHAALVFAGVLMVGSFALLWGAANLLTALLAFGGLAFYVVIYTLVLKRRTWWNIVIGGAAGAFPPLVGWAAVTGELSPMAWCLFGIIFLWTPVHFWALAIMIKEDYARAGVPMLPVVRGDRATVTQIGYYAILTVAISAVPLLLPGPGGQSAVGLFYLATAVLLNAVLLLRSFRLYKSPDQPQAKLLFKYSMVYLALLFLAMALDRAPWL